jgi:OOP family OmpA-OmpF porin
MFAGFAASADDSDLFDDRYYIAPMGSLTGDHNDSNYADGFGGGLAIGKSVMPHLGVEIVGDFLHYRGKTSTTPTTGPLCGLLGSCPDQENQFPNHNIYGGGVGVNYYISPKNAGLFFHADAEGGDHLMYNAGMGFDQPFFDRVVYVRAELLYHKETDYGSGPLFHLGVRIPLGGVHAAAQPEPSPPTEVVPVEQPAPAPEAAPEPAPAPAPCQPPVAGQPVSFEGCKIGDTIVLHGVNFEFNKASLTLNAKTLLDQVADALLARKDIKVEIDGHTDGVGSAPYNQKLSEARAASVKKYLEGRGVGRGRMSSKGFGKSMPIADNATDEGREQNRRVELKVTDSASAGAPPSEGQPASAPVEAAPASESPAAPAGDTSAPSDSGQPPSADTPAAAAPPAAGTEPAAEPATAPAPVKKHSARHHKQAAPADAAPSADASAQSESTPASPEPAPAPAPQDAGPASSTAPSEPAAPDQSTPPPPSTSGAAPSDDATVPTEPAPAPPEPDSPQADKPH